MRIFIIVFLIFIFILLFGLLIFAVRQYLSSGFVSNKKTTSKAELSADKEIGINELLQLVSDNNISRNDLFRLSQIFTKFSFPPKTGNELSNEAKLYLDFVLLVASHKNTDAKLISFVNKESKVKNPAYAVDIDQYEQTGIEQRKNRK
ncbi:hypothetical protein LMG7974_00302 [Campylobacter majalis]|uniref:Periplasmic protein n=1 Tax=Campylobacter majalis TaxID=2790656 RepID=A0ABN7K7P9_9BACT|nr:fatty-acid--CoA ligase [Campylobacter majalis]CAD7287423.1 hypothetical protein LMG7974_00302 [Campylobacter majalis]